MKNSGLTGSGVTTQQHLVTAQILRLASFTKRDTKLATQIDAFETILASFGSALTLSNPTASRHSTFTELHFSHQGKLQGGKVLAWGLDKGRVSKLGREERSFNAFYQLLAGATEEERRELGLLSDASEYNLLASSGYYSSNGRGMNGNDDGIALDKLRNAMALLSFKPRHVSSIFRLLSVILLLGNLKFEDRGEKDLNSESAWVSNRDVLETVASLLGTNSDDLESSLTNRVRWVRKEMCAIILKAEAAALQRDSLVEALYSILFAFVVETSNHKVFPGDEAIASLQAEGGSSILQLDSPGFTSKSQDRSSSSGTRSGNNNSGAVLMRSLNGFEEFAINYTNESVHFWLNERLFDGDSGMAALAQEDGVRLPDIIPPDGSARLELLRGGRIGGKADRKPGGLVGGLAKTCSSVRKGATTMEADEELLRGMRDHFGDQAAFVSNPGGPGRRSAFGINHFAGVVAYDAAGFIERDLDALDPEFVALLRGSEDGFISKLFSGPSLAAEFHPLDGVTIVSAQISNQPLRRPSPVKTSPSLPHSEVDFTLPLLNPAEIFPLTSQLNATVSQLLNLIDRTQLWSVICLRPNDSGNVGMIDSKRLKSQIMAYNLPELTARKQIDFVTEVEYDSFVGRYHGVDGFGREAVGGFMKSSEMDNGVGDRLREMRDYALGSTKVWLSYKAWKRLEDRLRVLEPEERAGLNRASTAILEVEDAVRGGGMEDVNFNSSRTNLGQLQQQPGQGWRDGNNAVDSVDDLLLNRDNHNQNQQPSNRPFNPYANTQSFYSTAGGPSPYIQASRAQSNIWGMDDDQQYHQEQQPTQQSFNAPAYSNYSQVDLEQQSQSHQTSKEAKGLFDAQGNPIQNGIGATVEVVPTSRGRMFWVIIVWALTWWVPSFCLTHVGRMKRPDVRMAWREKVRCLFSLGSFETDFHFRY
jgi:chitin synthase